MFFDDGKQRIQFRYSPDTNSPLPYPLGLFNAQLSMPLNLDTTTDYFSTSGNSGISDRSELIERIKAGETPTWIPTRNRSERYNPNHTPCNLPHFADDHPDRSQPALHQGVFTNEPRFHHQGPNSPPVLPSAFPGTRFNNESLLTRPTPYSEQLSQTLYHNRTPSLSSSFVFKPPTSPLARSSNPDPESDNSGDESRRTPSTGPIDIGFSEKSARRKSLPPAVPSSLRVLPTITFLPQNQHDGLIYNQHSVPDPWWSAASLASSKPPRRLSSFGGTAPELPFGSFVGSYEESILNGRMSTTPSKPLNFLAQIGVLGLGKCKQSLRCPTHVTLPFPAYFYSVGDYDSPSPYVGQIDIDTALGLQSSKGKKPPLGVGGSYRIPQRGQLQIVIKNPNKTAVKLFLVPYDLRDMEPGTKTFIRQKAYSVGELGGGDLPINPTSRQKEKDSLRYLIHLHIVCPSRGRYYIFKSIRVVFANRVPDGRERLRNEVLFPEPKYSTWKPESRSTTPTSNAISINGRKRSASLYGTAHRAEGRSTLSTPSPLPLLSIKPMTISMPVTSQKQDGCGSEPMGVGNEVDYNGRASTNSAELVVGGMDVAGKDMETYEKIDLSSKISNKAEAQQRQPGLLARRLKELGY